MSSRAAQTARDLPVAEKLTQTPLPRCPKRMMSNSRFLLRVTLDCLRGRSPSARLGMTAQLRPVSPEYLCRFPRDLLIWKMMLDEFDQRLATTLAEIRSQGLYKTERIITSPQEAHICIAGGRQVLNMCANNYLGLSDHPALIAAAKAALETHGFGLA